MAILTAIALVLTFAFFITREGISAWMAVPVWFALGISALAESTTTWDTFYSIFVITSLGFTITLALSAEILRRKDDNSELDEGTGLNEDDEEEDSLFDLTNEEKQERQSKRKVSGAKRRKQKVIPLGQRKTKAEIAQSFLPPSMRKKK